MHRLRSTYTGPWTGFMAQSAVACFAIGVSSVIVFQCIIDLIRVSFSSSTLSYIVTIPVLTAVLIYYKREYIFESSKLDPYTSAIFLTLSISALFYSGRLPEGWAWAHVPLRALSIAFVWSGVFALAYGRMALRRALFPLALLLFLVPLPKGALENVVSFLQIGTAVTSEWLLRVLRVPVFRDGLVLSIPGLNLEVDPECSGIRSAIVLLLTDLSLGFLFLRSRWRRLVLLLVVVPLAILKNAIRVVTLALLAAYIDPSFLTGRLHHNGGVLFFAVGLALVASVLLLLSNQERQRHRVMAATEMLLPTGR